MISIVTGTLNRIDKLQSIIENTVGSNEKLELVLVDGGSTDGTIEYIKSINHPRIKLVEIGERSYYWDYMNKGIRAAKNEWICQWNDDVLLENTWDDVIDRMNLEDPYDFYIFSWKEIGGSEQYVIYDTGEHLVLNFGIYNKKIFREIGLYNNSYKYYYCDADMSYRAKCFGYKYSKMYDIKCLPLTGNSEKKAFMINQVEEEANYKSHLGMYIEKILPDNIEFL
jgi:GT2 family glycosyltransferase